MARRALALAATGAVLSGVITGVAGHASIAPAVAANRTASSGIAAETPPLKIMPLGDSITFGVGSRTSSSYRVDLRQRLTAAGVSVDFVGSQSSGRGPDVENEGHGGWTIGQLAEQATGWLDSYEPDAVLLQIGTNDVIHSLGLANAPARLSALIDQIHVARPAAQIFVTTITSSKNRGYQARINAFNAEIPRVVAANGSYTHFVNQAPLLGIDLRDNVHPNDFGYAKMAVNWYRAIEKVYNTTGASWPAGVNPYRATKAYRCLLALRNTYWGRMLLEDCRWTYLRQVTSTVHGKTLSRRVWQIRRGARWVNAAS